MNAVMRQATVRGAEPGAPQRPRGERDAARARGGEQPRGGQPGHRDLVALPPVDRALAADEHGPEQRHVAEERARPPAPTPGPATSRCRAGSGSRSPAAPPGGAARSTGRRRSRRRTAPEAMQPLAGEANPRHLLRGRDRGGPGPGASRSRADASPAATGSPQPLAPVRRSSALSVRPDGRRPALSRGACGADRLGEHRAGHQVDQVVLAEVHERQAEQQGVAPAERTGDRIRPR